MSMNLIFTIGVAIAAAAALYYIFLDVQKVKQRCEMLAFHMKRIESMIITYNIRRQPESTGEESDVEHHEEHEEHEEQTDEEELHQPSHPSEEVMKSMIASMMGGGGSMSSQATVIFTSSPQVHHQIEERIEEMIDEVSETPHVEDSNEPSIPIVDSFDSFNAHRQIASQSIQDEPANEEPANEEPANEEPANEEPANENKEPAQQEFFDEPVESSSSLNKIRVYADNKENRRLGRVGKPY